jgi:4-amino-4-deoxy-L-arabinose transferase-like glycosyltransferase
VIRSLPRLALAPVATPGRALLLLMGLVALHAATRFFLPPSLGYDDAEQALFAQVWSLGYRFQQPPLVTWVLLLFRDVLGLDVGLASLTLLRSLLLVVLHVAFYLAARHWLGDPVRAALASLALAATYTLGWLSHADLLVSTSLAAAVAVSLWLWGRLGERPTLANCALFGIACGLGLLAKWNFVMLAVAYLVVGLIEARLRPIVLSWRTPVIVVTAGALAGPTALWVLLNHPSFTGLTQEVLVAPAAERTAFEGFVQLLTSAIAFPQPMLAVVLLVAWPALRRLPGRVRPLVLLLLVSLVLHALLIPLAGAVNFPERWMVTIELPLAILLLAAIPAGHARLGTIAAALLAIVVGAWATRVAIGVTDSTYCGKCRTRLPIAAFADGLRAAGLENATLVTSDMHLGGNLRLALPTARVVHPDYPAAIWPPAPGATCAAVWRVAPDRASTPTTGIVTAPILGSADHLQAIAYRVEACR